jgi:UPF0716 family protein affecting phage T7 exclusion
MRRGRLLLAAVCFVLAFLIQVMDFAGRVGIAWKLLILVLLAAGGVIFWRERRRASRLPSES